MHDKTKNNVKRNRNIGTIKQGHGKNNFMRIPERISKGAFYEDLKNYYVVNYSFLGANIKFVIEKTSNDSFYSLTPQDIIKVLSNISYRFVSDIRLIIFRNPTRKQRLIMPVWGRLIYYFEFENKIQPAIIFESIKLPSQIKRNKKMSIQEQKEFDFLKNDGYSFRESKREFVTEVNLDLARNTQLYRTLLHEVGHYYDYFSTVIEPLRQLDHKILLLECKIYDMHENKDSDLELYVKKWQSLKMNYESEKDSLEKSFNSKSNFEKEEFANTFASEQTRILRSRNIIPFDKIITTKFAKKNKLKLDDFIYDNEIIETL